MPSLSFFLLKEGPSKFQLVARGIDDEGNVELVHLSEITKRTAKSAQAEAKDFLNGDDFIQYCADGKIPSPQKAKEAAEKSKFAEAKEEAKPDPDGDEIPYADVEIAFGKHKGKKIKEAPKSYLKWMVEEVTDPKNYQKETVTAARAFLGLPPKDLPF